MTPPQPTQEPNEVRYIRQVNVRAVVTIAAVFNAIVGVAILLAGYLVIIVAVQHGVLDQVNSVTSDLSTGRGGHLSTARICLVWTLIVAVWTVVMTALSALATLIFNNLLQLMGGLALDMTSTPPPKADVRAASRRVATTVAANLRAVTSTGDAPT